MKVLTVNYLTYVLILFFSFLQLVPISASEVKAAPTSNDTKLKNRKSQFEKKRVKKGGIAKEIKAQKNPYNTTYKIEWFQPELQFSPKRKRTRVLLSGRAKIGSKVSVNGKRIPVTRKGKLKYIRRKSALVSPLVVSVPKSGLFEIVLDLPFAHVALPVRIVTPKGESQNYTLRIKVGRYKVKLLNTLAKRSPLYYKRYELWLGSGFNYLKYIRKGTDTGQELDYESFKVPSFFAEGKIRASEEIEIYISGKSSPGRVSSSDEINISEGDYRWETLSLSILNSPKSWKLPLFGNLRGSFYYEGGIQYHLVPFLQRKDTNSANVALISTNISMLSLGGGVRISPTYSWQFESFLRMQQPIAAEFQISNAFSFDGSLGIIYRNLAKWHLGLFWYGQFQTYDFDFEINQTNISGSQSLLFSNVEIRIGFEFN